MIQQEVLNRIHFKAEQVFTVKNTKQLNSHYSQQPGSVQVHSRKNSIHKKKPNRIKTFDKTSKCLPYICTFHDKDSTLMERTLAIIMDI